MIQTNATLSLQMDRQQMAQAQLQVSTGQKFTSFADDPQAQSSVMQTSTALSSLDQYQRNINDATYGTATAHRHGNPRFPDRHTAGNCHFQRRQ
jgi:flagellin-like hook-associated protein FlgL